MEVVTKSGLPSRFGFGGSMVVCGWLRRSDNKSVTADPKSLLPLAMVWTEL